MQLIGITGKSGAGKTTLANLLGKHDNVGVIHIDDLMSQFWQEKSSVMMSDAVRRKYRRLLYSNKYIFLLYIKYKSMVLDKKISKKIKDYEDSGKEMVVIEGVYLKYFSTFKHLDKRILLLRPYSERLESVLERDKGCIDKETFVLRDTPYKRFFHRERENDYQMIVSNTSLEKIKEIAEAIYSGLHINEKNRRQRFVEEYGPERHPYKLSQQHNQRQPRNDEMLH